MFPVRTSVAAMGFATPLLFLSLAGDAAERLEVTVRPTFATEPGYVQITAKVERHADNRWLVVEADAPTYFRSSLRQLEGEHEARTHRFLLKNMPAGDYKITVRVSGVDGLRAIEQRDFKVLGEAADGAPTALPRGRRRHR